MPEPTWHCDYCDTDNPLEYEEECSNCGTAKGWEYDGPEDVGDTTYDSPAVRAEMLDRARRLK